MTDKKKDQSLGGFAKKNQFQMARGRCYHFYTPRSHANSGIHGFQSGIR